MGEIKAIETVYAGYRFRSRGEARWAVFFDSLGITYEYEREGYETSAGWYLPDFWMPTWNCHVEIKGISPTEGDWGKCHSLMRESGNLVLVVIGQPWIGEYDVQPAYSESYNPNGQYQFATCGACQSLAIIEEDLSINVRFLDNHAEDCPIGQSLGRNLMLDRDDGPFSIKLPSAFKAARQARFEHGETPVIRGNNWLG